MNRWEWAGTTTRVALLGALCASVQAQTVAASVPGFIGFAVGRADFWQPLVDWRDHKATRETAVREIADRYQEFVSIFESGAGNRTAA